MGFNKSIILNDYQELCLSCHRKLDITEDTRRKFRERELNKNRTSFPDFDDVKRKRAPIVNVDLELEFNSITEAAKHFNILITSISNCLSGKSKAAGGYRWKYKNNKNEQHKNT